MELGTLLERNVPPPPVAHETAHLQRAGAPVHAAAQLGGEGADVVVGRVQQVLILVVDSSRVVSCANG